MREPDWSYRVFIFMLAMTVLMVFGFACFALGVAITFIPVQY